MRLVLSILMFGLFSGVAQAANGPPKARSIDGVLFVHAADLAASLNFKLNTLRDGQLLTFCREGQGGLCIPVRLDESNHRLSDGDVYLSAQVVSSAMQVRAVLDGDHARLDVLASTQNDDLPSYNAQWGHGRGFGVADTLPDIPLVDMNGNEVRFSSFLGKKYILYCWASW